MEHTDAGANVVLADTRLPEQASRNAYAGDEEYVKHYAEESRLPVTQSVPIAEDDERPDGSRDPVDVEQSSTTLATVLDLDLGLADLFGEPMEWQERALCAQTDPEAFFPEKGGSTREAKRICSGCEVRVECLEYALANDERFGIWGGMSERERRKQRRRAV